MSCCQSPSEEAAAYRYEQEEARKKKIKELGGVVKEELVEDEEEKSSEEVMQDYRDEMLFHCLEGERGIVVLNKLCSDLGYREEQFRYGSSLEQFLQDNSGCCEAIIEWITEQMDKNKEWKEALFCEGDSSDDGN